MLIVSVVVGALVTTMLSALGWIMKNHFKKDDERDREVTDLREDVAFMRGVLAMAFPATAAKVEQQRTSE